MIAVAAVVDRDLGRLVQVRKPADLFEAGLTQAPFKPTAVAAADLVGEVDLREVSVAELFMSSGRL